MKILGLDLSLVSTGWASLNDLTDRMVTGTLSSKPEKAGEPLGQARLDADRLKHLAIRCKNIAGDEHDLVCIEGVSMGSMGRLDSLYGLHWMTRAVILLPTLIVPPSTLKKFTTGKGNAKKDQMRLAVYKQWHLEAETDDEIDAIALAHFGAAFLGPGRCTNQAQREAVEAIRTPKVKKARKAA